MPTFRSYAKSDDAFSDAAFLCGMGLDATVFDERAFGGNALGSLLAWGVLMQLSRPPSIDGLILDSLSGLQWTMSGMALALMYWSPLSERFRA